MIRTPNEMPSNQQIADNLRAAAAGRRRSRSTRLLEVAASLYDDLAADDQDGES